VQLSILGPVLLDGSAPRGAKERALLARLLVAPGAPVPADTLIEAAWTPDRHDGVTRSLHVRIAKLRALLDCERGALVRDAAGYRLAVSPDSVDAHRFAALAEEASCRPPADALVICDEALALWRGEPFADLELPDEAATVEARRLHAIRDRLRRTRAAALTALGRAEEAAQALAALVAEDPLREELVADLMTARYAVALAAGERDLARAEYEQALALALDVRADVGPSLPVDARIALTHLRLAAVADRADDTREHVMRAVEHARASRAPAVIDAAEAAAAREQARHSVIR
jgi:DNA-binding SARP family transcriptional activator